MAFRRSLWFLSTALLRSVVRNDTLGQFLALPAPQQALLLESLAEHNATREAQTVARGQQHFSWRYLWQGIRTHFQLPCSIQTRRARGQWIAERFQTDSQVLLLGDDDLLGVELSQLGFGKLTVADCDPGVLKSIATATRSLPDRPFLVQGDFRSAGFLRERQADLICLDPPYNLKWARIFIEQALRSAGSKTDVSLMLMLNPRCFTAEDLAEILDQLAAEGFRLVLHRKHFNSYPLSGISQFFLRVGLALTPECTRKLAPRSLLAATRLHFSSDLFVLQRGHHEAFADLKDAEGF